LRSRIHFAFWLGKGLRPLFFCPIVWKVVTSSINLQEQQTKDTMDQLKPDVAAYYQWAAEKDARPYGVAFHLMNLEKSLRELEQSLKTLNS
jgi:hypothetical protein